MMKEQKLNYVLWCTQIGDVFDYDETSNDESHPTKQTKLTECLSFDRE
jgi:hypothetical protein